MATNRDKLDHYSLKAQKEGYPARSVYKLQEIQEKCGLIKKGQQILDVGSSPGSWSLYAIRLLAGTGGVTGVDLSPVTLKEFPPGCFFFQGDIFEEETFKTLESRAPFDGILSDAAPLTTGHRTLDTARSEALVERVIEISFPLLKTGGYLVAKIFQGGGERALTDLLRQHFTTVKLLKPKAVRSESFETYLIAQGKKP